MDGGEPVDIRINDKEKRVYVWLTGAESENAALRDSLKPLYQTYHEMKYLVAEFRSGTEDLEALTRDLLLYNRVRLRELEAERDKLQ